MPARWTGQGSGREPLVGRGGDDRTDALCQQVPRQVCGADRLEGGAEDLASFTSRYSFWWVYPCVRVANASGRLVFGDLPRLPISDRPAVIYGRFLESCRGQVRRGRSLVWILAWSMQKHISLYSFLHGWLFLLLMTIDPLLLGALLSSAASSDSASASWLGLSATAYQILLVFGLTLSMVVRVTSMEICYFGSVRVMNNMRSVLVHAVFRRALSVPDHKVDVGKLSNLMATDADKFGNTAWLVFSFAQWTWAVLSLPLCVFFLYRLVGIASFICLIAIVVGGTTFRAMRGRMKHLNQRVQDARDARSRMMIELIRGIRVVKLQIWEPLWLDRIKRSREVEMHFLVRVRIWNALCSLLGSLLSLMMPLSMFACFILAEHRDLDAATAFTALAWISTMRWSVETIPGAFEMYTYLKPSVDRIGSFLEGSSVSDLDFVPPVDGNDCVDVPVVVAGGHGRAISLEDAMIGHWRKSEESTDAPENKIVLERVNLQVHSGQLVMVAGPVGCGKSSLLVTMARGRPPLSGRCIVSGRCAYASQMPFLLNATVKENILFGLPFDAERYHDALQMAALVEDLQALATGDETLVGESGVQLSGGQKARVSLARVVYANADVILLDDVLSAVDAYTGRQLWDKCIIEGLKAKSKTVVLVSHQIQYLSHPEVDLIVLLRDGCVCGKGRWDELSSMSDDLLSFVKEWTSPKGEDDVCESAAVTNDAENPEAESVDHVSITDCQTALARTLQSLSGRRIDSGLIRAVCSELAGEMQQLEAMREGCITWPDFQIYLRAFGSYWATALLGLLVLATALFGIWSNLWLAIWTGKGVESPAKERVDLGIYAAIGFGSGVVECLRALVLTHCALLASRSIHAQMLHGVLKAPLSFFDVTPSGRLLNRFLQDMQNIDSVVPNVITDQIIRSLNVVTQMTLIYVQAPWVLATLPILVIPYQAIYRRMRIPNRDSRRIDTAAHSPVYAHFTDTLHGRETIRVFAAESRFEAENLRHTSDMATAAYGNNAVCKWAQILTAQWGCFLYLSCGLTCVLLIASGKMGASHMGLVLLYGGQLQRSMMDYMMSTAELEKNFVSVERVAEYIRLIPEEDLEELDSHEHDSDVPLESWPLDGSIEFQDVMMRYRLCRPLVLKGVTFRILPECKLALCGRTGCGKSSLFSVLCRLYLLSAGRVLIGGRSVASLPLHILRTHVRVVSQDAFLVSGTLRQNLALRPEVRVADEVLWQCLRMVGMEQKVQNELSGLDCRVEEGGQNFSVGERQLLTLARVLVPLEECQGLAEWRPPCVLLCDEATASVDLVADEKVHDVILNLESTVLMICHRLQHIHRFQSVVVMDAGRVVEQGPPASLTNDPNSRLSKLCAKAGLT